MEGVETTYFRGLVRLRGDGPDYSQYDLADGSAYISIPNRYHLRLVEEGSLPPTFEVVAPLDQVMVRQGALPERCVVRADHAYYAQLVDYYGPIRRVKPEGRKAPAPGGGRGCVVLVAAAASLGAFLALALT